MNWRATARQATGRSRQVDGEHTVFNPKVRARQTGRAEQSRLSARLTAVYEVTAGGQDRSVPLRFTAIWAKRPSGVEFVSWQSTGIPK